MPKKGHLISRVEEAKEWCQSNGAYQLIPNKITLDNYQEFLTVVKKAKAAMDTEVRESHAWCLAVLQVNFEISVGREMAFLKLAAKMFELHSIGKNQEIQEILSKFEPVKRVEAPELKREPAVKSRIMIGDKPAHPIFVAAVQNIRAAHARWEEEKAKEASKSPMDLT